MPKFICLSSEHTPKTIANLAKSSECKNDHDGSCEMFKSMKDDYKFTEENLKHCENFKHPKMRIISCRYGEECKLNHFKDLFQVAID